MNRSDFLNLRMRPDLLAFSQNSGQTTDWVIKDPVRLRYFHFSEEEYWVLRALDGTAGFTEIRKRFDKAFSPLQLSKERLQSFLVNLHGQGLLLSAGPGQSSVLGERFEDHQQAQRSELWSNPLAIRFPGFDPERLLDWLYPMVRLCFGPFALCFYLVIVLSAIGLLFVQSQHLAGRLPALTDFINAENLLLLALCLAVVKALHELAHALVCKHFGGECHELGIMLLVFTPCLYCNVTDSWIMRNRWHRIAISGAGIAVELVLAALATFGWWFSRPGVFNSVFLNVMVVSGVSTVLVNANPLLRYDGYYILSDLLRIPNLWQASRAAARSFFSHLIWGTGRHEMLRQPKHRSVLIAYAILSVLYRIVLITSIVWFLFIALKPLKMELLAYALAAVVLARFVANTSRSIHKNMRDPAMRSKICSIRTLVAITLVAAMVWALMAMPMPCRIDAHVVLEPLDVERVYAVTRGTLKEIKAAGQPVESDEVIASLENPELDLEILKLRGQIRLAHSRLNSLASRVLEDDTAAAGQVITEEILANLKRQLDQRLRDAEALALRSPTSGVILTPRVRQLRRARSTLDYWHKTPLDPRNVDCSLERGTLVCLVGDPQRLEAMLYVNEWDLEFVQRGQEVRLCLDALPAQFFTGKVYEVAQRQIETVPQELVAGQKMPGRTTESGAIEPLDTYYQVRVKLDQHPIPVAIGARGRAKITTGSQTLSERLFRYLRQTFAPHAAT